MKIIDFEKKGNVVRFYLGNDDLKEWYGDDWNDYPYEHNAGVVYDQFISGIRDIAFPFDALVLEPCEDWRYADNSPYCKEDMIKRQVPCIIVVPKDVIANSWKDQFNDWVGSDNVIRYYFGDYMNEDIL